VLKHRIKKKMRWLVGANNWLDKPISGKKEDA